MGEYLNVIVAAGILIVIVIFFMIYSNRNKDKSKNKSKKRKKDRNAIIRSANKKLSQNPKDPDALLSLAEIYYKEEDYKLALKHYSALIPLCAAYPDLDEFDITLKYALCSLKNSNVEEAYKSLLIAKSINNDNFDVNFNLGCLEYKQGNFEKAAGLLLRANESQSDHAQTIRFLGHSLFKIKRYQDAIKALQSTMEYEPDDKDSLFFLAQCYYKIGKNENALKLFTHMRTDPRLGPNAALFAGTIHMSTRNYQKAIMDFGIGLRHKDINPSVEIELKYRLSNAYTKVQEIERALNLLYEIEKVNPQYKDIDALIGKYRELNTNKTLQVYLIAPISEFVSLCRKLASNFYTDARAKLIDISIIKNEYIDILAEVSAKRWEDIVLFRFIRSTGTVGELVLRELYSRCKELRAGRGFCLSAGTYSEGAKQFVEARLIDLIEKKELMKLFSRLNQPTLTKGAPRPQINRIN
jgi:tetratricopeptide (TPR) repeat protein